MSAPSKVNPSDQVVRQYFQDYYMKMPAPTFLPYDAQHREYGFLLFKEKFMVRHRAFKTSESILQAIRDLVPRHVYYSTAYYNNPTASMDEKGWSRADLVFDIDADHLDTPCKKEHDRWTCKQCQNTGIGSSPKICPKCKSERIDEETWLCEQCLHEAKEKTHKLSDRIWEIGSDIGLEPDDVKIFFSGHRGYHIHILSKELSVLGEEGRREIVDYVLGQGFDPDAHLKSRKISSRTDPDIIGSAQIVEGPKADDPGWRRSIVMGIYEDKAALNNVEKERFLENPRWSVLGLDKSKTLSIGAVARNSAGIDTVVTTDIHRLIRLPGTLNGHTGFLAAKVPIERLDEFDPFVDAIAFKQPMKVHVKDVPAFKIAGEKIGSIHEENVELPGAAAILLLCKHRAEPVGTIKAS